MEQFQGQVYAHTTYTFSDGNRSPSTTWYGYPCWHQPGRDESGNYKPMYGWNNAFADASEANFVYNGNAGSPPPGCTPGASGNCSYDTIHTLANREYYNAVSASKQSNSTTPFNGTTGMGWGTAGNRPSTCTTSTEAGAGSRLRPRNDLGTIWGIKHGRHGQRLRRRTRSATNTWKPHYTPYTYPHPLVSGTPPPAPPQNLQADVS